MKWLSMTCAVLSASCLITQTHTGYAAELPDKIPAGQTELALNGWGARTKNVLQLYVAGLYLTDCRDDAAAIIAADEPMAIRIKITSLLITQSKLDKSLKAGFEKATRGNVAPIAAEMAAFSQCLADKIRKNDVFDLVYVPATGVMVSKNGEHKGVIKGLPFKQALFAIWLGEQPVDPALKQAMLTTDAAR